MNQLEFKENTREWCQARENTCKQNVIGFSLTQNLAEKVCTLLNQSAVSKKMATGTFTHSS